MQELLDKGQGTHVQSLGPAGQVQQVRELGAPASPSAPAEALCARLIGSVAVPRSPPRAVPHRWAGAPSLDEAALMAADAVALLLDVDPASIQVRVVTEPHAVIA